MTFAETLAWISSNIITPLFQFQLPFWAGVSFGSVIVAVFGLPLLVHAYRKLF